jgi:hypothetical protein
MEVPEEKIDKILNKLDKIFDILEQIKTKETIIMGDLDALEAQVTANVTVEQSAITLIQGIAAQLAAIINDPAAIAAMVTQLNTSAAALAAAVAANTPASAKK